MPISGAQFQIHFDGNGHTITGLKINRPGYTQIGLFGRLYDSSIVNLKMENVSMAAADSCGALAGIAYNLIIRNCTVSGTITGTQGGSSHAGTGGLIGMMEGGSISDCINYVRVTAKNMCGGIGGYIEGNIVCCCNYGQIKCTSTSSAGGITGCIDGTIKDCFNTADIISNNMDHSAGISGWHYGGSPYTYENCYNVGKAGYGIAAPWVNETTWRNCYFLGSLVLDTNAYGTSKTAEELKLQDTYTNFDFSNVWKMDNARLPVLRGLTFNYTGGISLDHSSLEIRAGGKQTMTATVTPQDSHIKTVIWTSGTTTVATVSALGEITALKGGTAVITAAALDGGYTASCTVTVKQPATGIQLNKTALTLGVGEENSLQAVVIPDGASNKTVTWNSGDKSVATVDETGNVKAISADSAVITATSEDGGYKADCTVTVIRYVSGIALDRESLTLNEGETTALVPEVSPHDATNKEIIWSTADEKIAAVDKTGKVTAAGEGNTVITAKTKEGLFSCTCSVEVKPLFLSFDTNSGSKIQPKQVRYNTTALKPMDPSKEGYKFGGWYSDKTCSSPWNFLTSLILSNTTIYAKWNPNTYMITFDPQKGSISPNYIYVSYNAAIGELPVARRTGYTFGGWYTSLNSDGQKCQSDMVYKQIANITLYAKWTINTYIILFNCQDGSSIKGKTVQYNELVAAPAIPYRNGYIFAGWYTEPSCINPWDFDTGRVTNDLTLYAKWTKASQYTIKATANKTSYGFVNGAGKYYAASQASLTAVPKSGCRFVRWSKGGKTVTYSYQYIFTVKKNRTLKAEFAVIGKPVITSAVSAGYNQIKITWKKATAAQGYDIYRSTKSGNGYQYIGRTKAENYTDVGLTAGKKYYYKVRALCTAGTVTTYGSYSAYKYATPLLEKPEGLKIGVNAENIALSWNAVEGAAGYEVFTSARKTSGFKILTSVAKMEYTHTGLEKGKTYHYKVRAYIVVGGKRIYGDYSGVVWGKIS